MSDKTKFKSNPYNSLNKFITTKEVYDIMKNMNIADFKLNDINLYQRAYIHKSYCFMKDYEEYTNDINALPLQEISYEKMEFLGDSVLGYITCDYLFQRYTHIYNQDEEFLTKMKNRLVCGEMLAKLANSLNFNKHLIISKHIDENCNGRNNKNILEDSFEAFIGALYLDTNDIFLVKKFLINVYEKYVDFSDLILNDNNYKDQLQRYLQNRFKEYPKYNITEINGGKFSCQVIKKDECISEGIGETKKKAEQNGAKNALIFYGVLN